MKSIYGTEVPELGVPEAHQVNGPLSPVGHRAMTFL